MWLFMDLEYYILYNKYKKKESWIAIYLLKKL